MSVPVIQNSPATLLARVAAIDGTYPGVADIEAVSAAVFNTLTGETTGSPTASPAECFYDSLVTNDPRWNDTTGFNFELDVPPSCFPVGDVTYQVEVLITPVTGAHYKLLWRLDCRSTYGT